jgi:hypothetical protein
MPETLKQQYNDVYEVESSAWDSFNSQACTDLDFALKAQHTEEEASRAEDQDRILYTIDKIGRQVGLLSGYEIKNRHILKIGPQGGFNMQEDIACGQHTKTIMSLMSMKDGYITLSDAFKWGTLVQGSNLIEIWRDRNGDLQFGRYGYNQFLLDNNLTKPDLSDCGHILTGKWVGKDMVKYMVPTASDRIKKRPLTSSSKWRFLGNPELANKGGLRLLEHWWRRKTRYEDWVISRVTGQEIPLKELATKFFGGDMRLTKFKIKDLKLENGNPALSKFSKPVDEIRLTIFIDEEMAWDGTNPLKLDDYNFVWVHGDFCPECPRSDLKLQGHVRAIRDPQKAQNRRTNQIYDLIESQLQGFRVGRDNYIKNPEEMYKSGQGAVLHIDENAPDEMMLEQIFRQFPASDVPASLFQALEIAEKDETEAGGMNQEIFGNDDTNADVPAILGKFRTGQALTAHAGKFQGYRIAKGRLGKLLVRAVQLNYPPEKVYEIINEYPVEGFYKKDLTRYDCTPVEGLLTDSQQQLFWLLLLDLRTRFPEEAHKIPLSVAVRFCPTPFKPELLKIMEQAEQQEKQMQQMQMQQQQRDAQLQEAVTRTQLAREAEDFANAQESRSEIPLNMAKTLVEIQKIGAEPLVNLIKEMVKFDIAKLKPAGAGK